MPADNRFFVVDRNVFHRVSLLGIDAQVTYLVAAMGTGKDHSTTAYGAHAVERYAGLPRGRAREGFNTLRREKLLRHYGKRERIGPRIIQRRRLVLPAKTKRDLIFMPSTLVTGTGTEQSPLSIIREMGDPLTIRMLVDLYGAHNLVDYWGIDTAILRATWEKKSICERGEWVIWGFTRGSFQARADDLIKPHLILNEEYKKDWSAFWARLGALTGAGLIEWIPTLFGSSEDDAPPIMPVDGNLNPELELSAAIEAAADSMMTDWQVDGADCELIVPVRRHLYDCEIRSIARLLYRPNTNQISQWFAHLCKVSRRYSDLYQSITGKYRVQDQVYIK